MIAEGMSSERRRYSDSGSSGTFRPITADNLRPNAVAASCLDDQYIDREMLLSNRSLGFRQRYTERVLDEFAKCLLSAEQIVVNRTYLQNTEVMQHLAPSDMASADDTAIVRLIDDGAIVPYLYGDDDPTLKKSMASGAMDDDAVSAWNRVCERTEPHCLRLSWDDAADERLRSERLATRFAQRLQAVAEEARPELLQSLTHWCSEEEIDAFGRYLRNDVLPIARDGPTRRQLYEKLIIRKDSNIAKTEIDMGKMFSREIKQLIDLLYNANLAGALGLNNVTPSCSVNADILSDIGLETARGKSASPEMAAAIVAMAVRQQRDHYDGEAVPVLGALTLDQVVRIRDHSSWRRYVRAVSQLNELDPGLGADAFCAAAEEAFSEALERSRALRDYLYQHHGARRQARTRTRSLIAQAGNLCLGAAIGAAVGPTAAAAGIHIPGAFAENIVGGLVQTVAERPLRYLAMKVDPLGQHFAAWRLPDLQLDGGPASMAKFRRELAQMRIATTAIDPTSLGSPTIEAQVAGV